MGVGRVGSSSSNGFPPEQWKLSCMKCKLLVFTLLQREMTHKPSTPAPTQQRKSLLVATFQASRFLGSPLVMPKTEDFSFPLHFVPDQCCPNLLPNFIPLLLALPRESILFLQLLLRGHVAQFHGQCIFPLHLVS